VPIGREATRTISSQESGDVSDSRYSLQRPKSNFTMKRRSTVLEVPRFDLSEAMEQHYRQYFEHEGRGQVFMQWIHAMDDGDPGRSC
jgi:hypothetical protein